MFGGGVVVMFGSISLQHRVPRDKMAVGGYSFNKFYKGSSSLSVD